MKWSCPAKTSAARERTNVPLMMRVPGSTATAAETLEELVELPPATENAWYNASDPTDDQLDQFVDDPSRPVTVILEGQQRPAASRGTLLEICTVSTNGEHGSVTLL